MTKLTADKVLAIRALHADGASNASLADMFDVSAACVSHAVTGKMWSHVGGIRRPEKPPQRTKHHTTEGKTVKTEQIHIKIDADTKAQAKQQAAAEGRSLSNYILELIKLDGVAKGNGRG